MKIIHTADWHLGKILNGNQLLEDQKYILTKFIDQMKQQQPDVIVIAGDLYDTTYPSKETIKLLEETIAKLNLELKIPIIMISGNHDGKERLNYGADWFEHNQLYIKTKLEDFLEPIKLNDINFYTLPYATVSEMQYYFEDDQVKTHQQGIARCISEISKHINTNEINILISHLTVQGGKTSDSERPLTIGTVESIESSVFNPFNHVMLGHLHHPFSINDKHIKYSGSLLQYSFSEAGQAKGYREVTIDAKHNIVDTFVPLVPLRQLEIVEGEYQDVIEEKIKIKNKDNYFHFKLKNMSHIIDPMMHLKEIYPNTLALTNETFSFNESNDQVDIEERDDFSIIEQFFQYITDESLTDVQSKKIINIIEDIERREE
ncbi:exonuclease subunit SbcD [Staphylococcus simiae]|uniref:Nuclease SbcCD subunit D n=1 Tax=Staphylococcus simiae CCM 7213 = CCUG 51256 TaxID=911238 RepID=G5JLW2_9STAP|nr:exonuclease subunit SbcD [Staphylococcus simiae]EHJ06821.1 exonuclease SbcD [Staphylococcus simiae CCM 7213 = CCUG 51256]PNZ08783.1 exonuclease SbcCD subunit D [Staphylococcus simiae]SNV70604.1 SbcD protein [Staphylococcus simiae]